MDCANHVCVSSPSASGGGRGDATSEGVDCPHCHSVAYCSEQCRYVDWVKHDCANVVRVGARADTLFVPYHYEDTMTLTELGEPDMRSPLVQSYVAVHHGEDHTVVQTEVPALISADSETGWTAQFITPGRGVDPTQDETLARLSYEIRVSQPNEESPERDLLQQSFFGTFPRDTIYDGNDDPRVAALLGKKTKQETATATQKKPSFAKRFANAFGRAARRVISAADKIKSSVIFWPLISDATYTSQYDITGNLKIELFIGNGNNMHSVGNIRGGYDMSPTRLQSGVSATVKKAFELRLGGKASLRSTAGLRSMRAQAQGVIAVVTMEIEKKNKFVTVRDIELVVPVQLLKSKLYNGGAVRKLSDVDMDVVRTLTEVDREEEGATVPVYSQLSSPIAFRCDPSSTAQLVGLTMALENTFATNKRAAADASLQQAAGVVRKYTRACLDAPASAGASRQDVPMDVNTAIRSATEKLYEYNVSTRA